MRNLKRMFHLISFNNSEVFKPQGFQLQQYGGLLNETLGFQKLNVKYKDLMVRAIL
jgi:hypothetical protein